MTAPTMLKLDELQLLDAVSRGHVHRAETGAIWYSPRFVRGAGINTGATKHRVDRAFGKLRAIGLVDLVREGTCPITEAGKQVLAIQRAARAEAAAAPAPRPAPVEKSALESVSAPAAARGVLNWHDKAACRDEDPELFFPVGISGPALLQEQQAKHVCLTRCTVRRECLEFAMETGSTGVWGGTSERERAALAGGVLTVPNGLRTHCKRGRHELTPDNTYVDANGCRRCLTCRNETAEAYNAKRREGYGAEKAGA